MRLILAPTTDWIVRFIEQALLELRNTIGTMADYTIQPASELDPQIMVAMHDLEHVRGLLNKPTVDEVVRRLARESSNDFVGFDSSGNLAGLLLMDRNTPWLFEFSRVIAVRPFEGIGSFLMRWGLRYAFEKHKGHRAFLEVHERNTPSRRMCERLGFRQEGVYRDGFRNPLDGRFENLCPYGMLECDYWALHPSQRVDPEP